MATQEKNPQPERPKKTIKIFNFKPEGYVHVDDDEFLDQLFTFIRKKDIDPDEAVFSGTDASKVFDPSGSIKRPEAIFAMDKFAWETNAAKSYGETTPAGYTRSATVPCILILDTKPLAEAYSYKLEQDPEDPSSIVKLSDIIPGSPIVDLPKDKHVEEVVIHKDYPANPDASPMDALVGIVYLNDH